MVVAVAIARLGKHEGEYFAFYSPCQELFRFLFALVLSEADATNTGNPWDHRASAALWTCQNEGYTHNAQGAGVGYQDRHSYR